MAPLPLLPNTARAKLKYSDGSGKWGSRFFLNFPGPVPSVDMNAVAATIAAAWFNDIAPIVHVDYTLVEVIWDDVSISTGAQGVWSGSHPGSLTGDPLPSSTTVNGRILIEDRYRGGHPVMHLPPPSVTELGGTRIYTPAYVATALTQFRKFFTDLTGSADPGLSGSAHVVPRHYRSGLPPGATTISFVRGYDVSQTLGNSRRRLRTDA